MLFPNDSNSQKNWSSSYFCNDPIFIKLFHNSSAPKSLSNLSDRKLVDVNKAWEHFIGLSKENVIGFKVEDLNIINTEKADQIRGLLELEKNVKEFEIELKVSNDEIKYAIASFQFIEIDGNDFVETTLLDITDLKNTQYALELLANKSLKKKDIILELSGLVGSDFEVALSKITSLSANALNVERVSVWKFDNDKTEIECIHLFNLSSGKIEKGKILKRSDNIKYFETLDKNKTICVNDAFNNEITKGFSTYYLTPLRISSILDVFLKTDFGMYGILCFEHIGEQRNWSADDQEFATSIANIVTLMVESTERKNAEAKLIESEFNLRKSQTAANIGSYKYNVESNTWEGTEVLEHIFGIDASYERSQDNWNALLHSEDKENVISYFTDILSKRHKKVGIEYRIIRQNDKEVRWVNSIGELTLDDNGVPTYIFGTIQDITEKKIIEGQIKETNEKLYQSNIELNKLKEQLEQENIYLKDEINMVFNYEEMVYGSLEFSNVLTDIEKVASTNATVLLMGESGTGKELLARAVHNTSLRKTKPLIKVNCSAIPRELIESELFGHKKGSFTGAVSDKIGKFELAHQGTLFLDEIGELPLDMQPKLLRFLQEGEIEVVGGTDSKRLDVRVIAATNKNLQVEINNKKFREDLYFRLNVFPIVIPPLRSRKDDIPLLIQHFVIKFNEKYTKKIKCISEHSLRKMDLYEWPGNIRELENLIERAMILTNEDTLIVPGFESEAQLKKIPFTKSNLTFSEVQRNYILDVLGQCNWKINGPNGACAILDLKPSTLRDKLSKLGIKRPNNK